MLSNADNVDFGHKDPFCVVVWYKGLTKVKHFSGAIPDPVGIKRVV